MKEPMDITKIIPADGVSYVQWSPAFFSGRNRFGEKYRDVKGV
jgi:hypothetical protein